MKTDENNLQKQNNTPVCYSRFAGRIGNMMFILACGIYYSRKHNMQYKAIVDHKANIILKIKDAIFNVFSYRDIYEQYGKYIKSFAQYPLEVVNIDDIKNSGCIINTEAYSTEYSEISHNDKGVLIKGYKQCPSYFTKELAIELFGIDENIRNLIKFIYPEIPFDECVSIHIRLGDYLILVKNKDGFVINDKDFYNIIFNLFPEDQKYVIISDDIISAHNYITSLFPEKTFYFINKHIQDVFVSSIIDMYVPTLCKHNVISNSTFCWWGAYLNQTTGRKVYYQAPWYDLDNAKKDTVIKENIDYGLNIIPKNDAWISIMPAKPKMFGIGLGRIGNIMFQLAAGLYWCKKNNRDFYYMYRHGYGDYYDTLNYGIFHDIKLVTDEQMRQLTAIDNTEVKYFYNSGVDDYNALPDDISEDITPVTCGWRFDPRYFTKEFAIELFAPGNDILEYIHTLYGDIDFSECVSVNVRRGDFLVYKDPYVVSDIGFYNKVFALFSDNQKYIITSDDIEWCKEHFTGNNFIFIDRENNHKVFDKKYIDLYIPTLCKHNIISNSTFSWWGAYLNQTPDRMVYYQTPWLSDGNGGTIIPKDDNHWIGISLTESDNKDDIIKTEKKLISGIFTQFGNMLFSMAAAEICAEKNGFISIEYVNNYNDCDSIFDKIFKIPADNIQRRLLKKDIYSYSGCNDIIKKVEEHSFVYKELFTDDEIKNNENFLIFGYYQHAKYLDRDIILSKFVFTDELLNTVKDLYKEIPFENAVGVHIRRGDYLTDDAKFHGFVNTTYSYYKKAINDIHTENTVYVILSDDYEWCHKYFHGDKIYYADKKSDKYDKKYIDFVLLTLCCRGDIISASSYSWWGAYLNTNENRKVYYPNAWHYGAHNNGMGIIPDDPLWIGIDL